MTHNLDRGRRDFMMAFGMLTVAAIGGGQSTTAQGVPMYGLIGKINAVPGQREALVAILLDGVAGMPGCLSYVVARDPAEADALWVTEVWESRASHESSLSLPSVQQAITKGRPLIAGFGERFVTEPVGGFGLASSDAR